MGEIKMASLSSGRSREKESLIPSVKHVIAVSSGKGGVGKSTVAASLAVALAQSGATVGLMDADIYGPNIPIMMGVERPPEQQDGKLLPAESHGVKLISMGFFVPEETAVVWRGPMVHKALEQFFRDVLWGELDYLLIDLPPGTGDAQLTLSQLVPLSGAITVTTPQEVALYDVRKGMMMFQQVNVPLLGIIENMSFFLCPIAVSAPRSSPMEGASERRQSWTFPSWAAFRSIPLSGLGETSVCRLSPRSPALRRHRHSRRSRRNLRPRSARLRARGSLFRGSRACSRRLRSRSVLVECEMWTCQFPAHALCMMTPPLMLG
jgi:Mrp family chromosome partitioning ATPase